MINITNLHDGTYGEILRNYFSNDLQHYVIAPFINTQTLQKLLGTDGETIIITSWRTDHLISGYSSLDLYEMCHKNNWTLFINDSLHAKIYSNSMKDCFLGSANITEAALFSKTGNIECLTYIEDLGPMGRIELNRIMSLSTLVNDRIFLQYQDWFKKVTSGSNIDVYGLNIQDLTPFYISQLPATDDPIRLTRYLDEPEKLDVASEHDLAIYGMIDNNVSPNEFIDKLFINFFEHPFIKMFNKRVKEKPIFFGEAKIWIQNNCVNVPLPHRKDLSCLVHNLFYWFKILDSKHYAVEIPKKHSECLHYIK